MPSRDRLLSKAYGDSEGPLGFPMHSDAAKELEATIAELDTDCRSFIDAHGEGGIVRVRANPVSFEMLEGERADVSLVNTDSVDRDQEIVRPGGGNWKSFTKGGGPVTFAHKYSELPVGRAAWVKRVKDPADGWLAKTLYKARPAGWEGDWFPDAVFAFVQDGMRGKSIGFIPTKGHQPVEKEIEEDPRLEKVNWIIDKWVGLEYAVTPVQSNPDAVTIAVSKMRQKGLNVPDIILDEMGLVIPDVPVTPVEKAEEFNCTCIDCGHAMKSEKHCKDIKCPECGGEMRRAERPGPGRDASAVSEGKALVVPKPVIVTVDGRPIGRSYRMPAKKEDAPEAKEPEAPAKKVAVMTKKELAEELAKRLDTAMSGQGSLSPAKVVKHVLDRMSGRV